MKRLTVLLLTMLLVAACTTKEKRPSPDSLLSVEAFGIANGMKDAYVEKDFRRLEKYCTKEGYDSILRDIRKFESVELEFTPRWVEIKKDGDLYLNVSWSGTWKLKNDIAHERGMAVFVLVGKPLRLSRIIRGSPFNRPERR
jgi:hypothetical protein